MAITQSGTTVTVSGYYAGTFAASAGTSTTMTTTGMTSGGYVKRIVAIVSGTGVGATGLVTANTTTLLTCADYFWMPSASGGFAKVTPDSTSVFAIMYNFDDLYSAVPTYCYWDSTTVKKSMTCTQNMVLAANTAIGDWIRNLKFNTNEHCITSTATTSWFQMGRINTDGDGMSGGILQYTKTDTTLAEVYFAGRMYLFGNVHQVDKYPSSDETIGDGEGTKAKYNIRYNLATAPVCLGLNNTKLNYIAFSMNAGDVWKDVDLVKSASSVVSAPLFMGGMKAFEGNLAFGAGAGTVDVWDMSLSGDASANNYPRAVAMYSTQTYDRIYLYRLNQTLAVSGIVAWEGIMKNGTLELTNTIDITTHDTSDAAVASVKVGVIKSSDYTGQIITAKDTLANNYAPIKSRFITTNGSGLYTGPFGTSEGIALHCYSLVYSSELVSTVTTHGPYTLIFTKYGYIQQVQSRNYGYKNANSETSFLVVDPYSVAAYATAIAYTGMAMNVTSPVAGQAVLTGAQTFQHLYDFVKARIDYEAGTNDTYVQDWLSSTDGINFTIASGWSIKPQNYLDYTGFSLNGNLEYDTAGTFSPILGTATLTFSAASGSFDFSGATMTGVQTLINTGGGSIDVYLPAGTGYVNTGPNITLHVSAAVQGLSFTGLAAGSQVVVFETGTQTELYRDNSSTTTSYFSQTRVSDVTVDYTIMQAGYVPIRVTGVLLQSAVLATPIQQDLDRSYTASSGLTYGTTATVDPVTTLQFALTTDTTTQNFYSFWIEAWIAQSALTNTEFPLKAFGPSSVTLKYDYEFDGSTSIAHLSRGGIRYLATGDTVTAIYSGFLSTGAMTGLQAQYQQTDGGTTTNTASTGIVDQLIQTYGDATHGNFDYSTWMVFKAQADGYDQAESDVYATYGALVDELYIFGLAPLSNGLTTGDPSVTGVTITDHGASPVTWNGVDYSLTITDSATVHTGEEIMRWLRYNYSLGGTFQSKDTFDWHDLVQKNGTKYKTVRGAIYGDTGATTKGVRVVQNDGTTGHADFDLHTGDTSSYAPPVYQSVTITGLVSGSRVQVYDTTSATELYNDVVAATSYQWLDTVGAVADRAIRVRITYCSGTTAYDYIQQSVGTCGQTSATSALSYIAEQTLDTVYNANGIDGSAIYATSGITFTDATVDLVNCNIAGGAVSWATIYACFVYWMNTATGIANDITYISAIDQANFILTSMQIKNTSATPLTITGGWGRDATTLSIADVIDVAGSTGNIYPQPDHVVGYSSGSGLTAGESANLSSIKGVTDQFSFTVANQVDANALAVPAGATPPTVAEITADIDANSTQLAKLGTPAGASVSADIAAVKADTGKNLYLPGTGPIAKY